MAGGLHSDTSWEREPGAISRSQPRVSHDGGHHRALARKTHLQGTCKRAGKGGTGEAEVLICGRGAKGQGGRWRAHRGSPCCCARCEWLCAMRKRGVRVAQKATTWQVCASPRPSASALSAAPLGQVCQPRRGVRDHRGCSTRISCITAAAARASPASRRICARVACHRLRLRRRRQTRRRRPRAGEASQAGVVRGIGSSAPPPSCSGRKG